LRGKDSSTLLGSPNSTFSEGDVAPRMVAGASEKVTRRLGRGRDSTTGSSMRAFSGTKSKPSSLPGANSDSPAFSGMEIFILDRLVFVIRRHSWRPDPLSRVEGVQGLSYGVLRWASRSLVILNGDQKLAMVSNVCSRLFLKRREIVVQTLLALTQVCHYLVKLFACHLVTMRGMSACKERSDRVVARRSLERDFTSVLGSLTAVAFPTWLCDFCSNVMQKVFHQFASSLEITISMHGLLRFRSRYAGKLRQIKRKVYKPKQSPNVHNCLAKRVVQKNLFRALVMRHAAVHETIRTKLVSKIAIVHTQPTVRLVSALVTVRSLSSDITFYLLR
ncbi:hypothetical protein KCU80_g17, partial [Aureobasidium melanogenum]